MAKVVNYSNSLTSAAWAGDFFDRDHMIPGGAKLDVAAFVGVAQSVVAAAIAPVGATTITVQPLTSTIPKGTVLTFTGPIAVTVSVDTPLGATSLPVVNVPTQIGVGVAAPYTPSAAQATVVPGGTIVGRTLAEAAANAAYGPAGAADDEVYVMCFDVADLAENNDIELYRPNSILKENFLPGYAAVVTGVKTKLRAAYVCVLGAA